MLLKGVTGYKGSGFRNILLLVILALTGSVNASDDWSYTVTPYLWITGQEGKVATLPPAPPADLDISFSDVIDNLDIALMGLAEARKGRFGIFSELFYVGISADAATPGGFYSGADYEQDLWGLSLGGSYEMSQSSKYQVHAVTGVRFWLLDNDLDLKAGLLPATRVSERENWADLFVGLRGRAEIDAKWYVSGWAVSAVAGDSDTSWDVFGGVGYKYSDSFSLNLGYRHQVVDYRDGQFLFDIEMSGPTVGLLFRL